jgi:hypothetical protein
MDDTQVADFLTRALTAVDTAKIPDDLREIAFTNALPLLTGGLAPAAAGPTGPMPGAAAPPPPAGGATVNGSTG